MNRISVATIDKPEFINVSSINPLISQCEIKVLYIGKNRNKTFIDKSAATAIGRTLPGSPIVGYYKKDKKDFADHGEQIIFDDEGMKVNDLTRPYGFVPTDAKVWFQKFIDTDEYGIETEREYLMTTGYLWTGQYEEAKKVYEDEYGNPHSMKLHEKTLEGHWAKDVNGQAEFFIINDAIIQNLCILGEDVEPCFECSDIKAPKISSNFSKDNNFVTTLFTMMQELNEVLNKKEGGNDLMPEVINDTNTVEENDIPVVEMVETPEVVEAEAPAEVVEAPVVEESTEDESSEKILTDEGKIDETVIEENQVITEEFTKTSDEKKADDEDEKDKDDDEKCKKDYQLLEQSFVELQNKYSELETSYNELLEFKNKIEDEQKDALIAQFCMLSDEDKKDVIENKSKYSLDDIEAKLSVICVRKKVNFDLDSDKHNEVDEPVVTYNLNDVACDNLPAWLKAVESTKNRNQ